jgi:hypothetical protein
LFVFWKSLQRAATHAQTVTGARRLFILHRCSFIVGQVAQRRQLPVACQRLFASTTDTRGRAWLSISTRPPPWGFIGELSRRSARFAAASPGRFDALAASAGSVATRGRRAWPPGSRCTELRRVDRRRLSRLQRRPRTPPTAFAQHLACASRMPRLRPTFVAGEIA